MNTTTNRNLPWAAAAENVSPGSIYGEMKSFHPQLPSDMSTLPPLIVFDELRCRVCMSALAAFEKMMPVRFREYFDAGVLLAEKSMVGLPPRLFESHLKGMLLRTAMEMYEFKGVAAPETWIHLLVKYTYLDLVLFHAEDLYEDEHADVRDHG